MTFVHIFKYVLHALYRSTRLDINMTVVLEEQIRVVRYNPSVVNRVILRGTVLFTVILSTVLRIAILCYCRLLFGNFLLQTPFSRHGDLSS